MKNLVTIQEAKAVTSSLQVSSTFQKRHDHVLRDIENLKKDVPNFGEMFAESSYLDSYSRKHKMYIINRDGFTLLAMGFTGKKALQFKIDYINAFNRMEEYIKKQQSCPVVQQPTLPKRKATGKRVETYLPNEDVLRLQIAAYQEGYQSVYHLMQCLVYEFLENPYSNVREKVKHAEQERDTWKRMYEERNQFINYMFPFIQEMNRTIDEERALRKKYEKKLNQIKASI